MASKKTSSNKLNTLEQAYLPKPYTLDGFAFSTLSSPLDITDPLLHQELMECASPLFDDLLAEHRAFNKENPEARNKIGQFLSEEWDTYLFHLNIFVTIDNGRLAYIRDDTCTSQHDYLNGTLSMSQIDCEKLILLPPDTLPVIDD